jgi:asparagine synthase (glutamine-hydrolysing)
MCGIVGRISKAGNVPHNSRDASKDLLAILRRGPDSFGTQSFICRQHAVMLGHTRLSIIDLSRLGAQPMQDKQAGWWITYNGEIYNFAEIREELRREGREFESGSDTEVLLKAWSEWGLAALPKLNGMFAFAAFHPGRGELWLVRDRFGVKPLCWAKTPQGGVLFSSSVAGLASEMGQEIDTAYCARGARYKVYETAESGTPFRNVLAVPAGSWVQFQCSDAGLQIAEGRWYDLRREVALRQQEMSAQSGHALVERCSHLLDDAVRLRLRSDVPLAVSLSGGLDSTTVAALAARNVSDLRGFTYGSADAMESEGPEVERFATASSIKVNYVWPAFNASSLSEALERTFAFQEAPFIGLSPIAQNEVYRSVQEQGFKVLLGGQGADEIFAGYRKFFVMALREAVHLKKAAQALGVLASLGTMLAHEGAHARVYWQNRHRYRKNSKLAFRLLAWEPAPEDLWGPGSPSLCRRQIDDVLHWSLPTLLRYEDRNSMGFGVESRLPFMDYRLVETALALPVALKIHKGFGKWALRAAAQGVVPDPVRLNRKKRGFDVTQTWVTGGIGAALRQQILDNRQVLEPHLRYGIPIADLLSDDMLARDDDLLTEALMLAWLVNPVRRFAPTIPDSTQAGYREKNLSLLIRS